MNMWTQTDLTEQWITTGFSMREIKFRYWNGLKIEEVGQLSFFTNGVIHINEEYIEGKYLMQYTGIKDRNGKEIYDGDIMSGLYGEQEYEKDELTEIKGQVIYDSGSFIVYFKGIKNVALKDIYSDGRFLWRIENSHTRNDWYYHIIDIEVIGNIYQNSDLLK